MGVEEKMKWEGEFTSSSILSCSTLISCQVASSMVTLLSSSLLETSASGSLLTLISIVTSSPSCLECICLYLSKMLKTFTSSSGSVLTSISIVTTSSCSSFTLVSYFTSGSVLTTTSVSGSVLTSISMLLSTSCFTLTSVSLSTSSVFTSTSRPVSFFTMTLVLATLLLNFLISPPSFFSLASTLRLE